METVKPNIRILKLLLKDFTIKPTITVLSKEIDMSRVGTWKVLKKLETEQLIFLSSVGEGKTSTYNILLNWKNPLLVKTLALALTEESIKNPRWLSNFKELESKLDFLLIYGSIIHSPKEANDIDLLGIISKKNFLLIEEIIKKIQKTQIKKIHLINLTSAEFKAELKKPNKVFVDAVKKGIVLFGQEKFIKFINDLSKK
ncbi:hypothetical protein J4403_04475 [Candidatus Woesearchaeota archaeon]|nr:hypothetical protein [Candidatus Woesearchaeota archaeon]